MTEEEIKQLSKEIAELQPVEPLGAPYRVQSLDLATLLTEEPKRDTGVQNSPRLRPKNAQCSLGDLGGLKLESVNLNFTDLSMPDMLSEKPKVTGVKNIQDIVSKKAAAGGLF